MPFFCKIKLTVSSYVICLYSQAEKYEIFRSVEDRIMNSLSHLKGRVSDLLHDATEMKQSVKNVHSFLGDTSRENTIYLKVSAPACFNCIHILATAQVFMFNTGNAAGAYLKSHNPYLFRKLVDYRMETTKC